MLLTRPLEHPVGIGVQADLGGVADADVRPGRFRTRRRRSRRDDRSEIVNGLGAQSLHARGIGDLLIGDDSRDGRNDVHDSRRMVGIVAEQPQMFRRRLHVDLRLVLGVLRRPEGRSGRLRRD